LSTGEFFDEHRCVNSALRLHELHELQQKPRLTVSIDPSVNFSSGSGAFGAFFGLPLPFDLSFAARRYKSYPGTEKARARFSWQTSAAP
jgi:hypothetical protein